MKKLIFFELLKVWTKKSFIYAIVFLVSLNIFLLWYINNRVENKDAKIENYKTLNREMKEFSHKQKVEYINRKYNKLEAFDMIEMIKLGEAQQNEERKEYAKERKEKNKELYNKYIEQYEKEKFLDNANSIQKQFRFISKMKEETVKVDSYSDFLGEIKNRSNLLNGISLFQSNQDGFSSRNIQKTAQEYKKMDETKVDFQVSKGIDSLTNSTITDVIILCIIFILSSILIMEDKERNLFTLVKSTKNGRTSTIIAKIIALGINIGFIAILMYGINFIFYGIFVGYGNLLVSIQSISTFIGCTMRINIIQYISIFLVIKCFVYFLISLIIVWISIYAKYSGITYLSFGIIISISVGLYISIPAISNLNAFKYINLVSLLNTNGILKEYLNINLFGNPSNSITTSLIFLFFSIIVLIVVIVISFNKKREMSIKSSSIKQFFDTKIIKKKRISISILGNEIYKLFITNKALLIVLIFMVFQFYQYLNTTRYLSADEYYYKSYMSNLEGKLTTQKEEYIKQEQKKFEDAQKAVDKIQQLMKQGEIDKKQGEILQISHVETLNELPVFLRIVEQYEYIKENPNAQFVYDTGYKYLIGINENNDIENAFILSIVSILCFSSIFTMEYKTGAIKIISTTPKGREYTVKAKLLACMLVLIILFIASILPDILMVKEYYGMRAMSSSSISIKELVKVPGWINIGSYLGILYGFRFICISSILIVITWISTKLKDSIYTIFLSTILVVFPLVFILIGFPFARYLSFSMVYNINSILQKGIQLNYIYIVVTFLIVLLGIIDIKRKFGIDKNQEK